MQVEETRKRMEEIAERIATDEAFKEQIRDDPEGTLRACGMDDEDIARHINQQPGSGGERTDEVQGYGFEDSCWTWSWYKCGGGTNPTQIDPNQLGGGGGGNIVAMGGMN